MVRRMFDMRVTMTGTAAAITGQSIEVNRVTLTAALGNTGRCQVGDVNQQSDELDKGDSMDLFPDDINEIYAYSSVPGDVLNIKYYIGKKRDVF